MDENPPPYEEKYSGGSSGRKLQDVKMTNRPYNLDDQATASRSMLVSAAAEKIHAALEQRALYGISKTKLVVIPSGHGCSEFPSSRQTDEASDKDVDLSGSYKIAEYDEKPITIELTGDFNSVEFWSQTQAVDELRRQVASRIGGGRGSMLHVMVDEVHVRYETPFGEYDTMSVMAIIVDMV